MKKSILKLAVAASLVVPAVAMAESTVYGNVHLSLNAADNDIPNANNNLTMSSNTSSVGVKGSEDLGDGLKAIYKVEFGVDILDKPTTNPDAGAPNDGTGVFNRRDQFVGLKGGFGTVKFGTFSSNYKQMGGKVDPLYRTPLEGRGFLGTQSSALHGGSGINRGRQTNTLQYVSPKFSGIQLVANTTFSGAEDETNGVGIRWSNKAFLVYLDWIDGQTGTAIGGAGATTEAATKVGGKWSGKAISLAAQYEAAEDRAGADFIFLAGTWSINKNNSIVLTYGMADVKVPAGASSADQDGVALAYNHKLSKMTNIYVGYGAKSSDVDQNDESMLTAGIKKKF